MYQVLDNHPTLATTYWNLKLTLIHDSSYVALPGLKGLGSTAKIDAADLQTGFAIANGSGIRHNRPRGYKQGKP